MTIADFSLSTSFPKIPSPPLTFTTLSESYISLTPQNQDCSSSNMVTVTVHDTLN